MMDIYVKMEMITNRVLHFHYRKVGFYFRNRKLLNIRMEENSSVGKLVIFKFDLNIKQVGLGVLEITIGNCQTTEQRKIPLVKFTPFIDCGDTELKTEENSSVENWIHLSYDGYLC